jgi:hypothetical protein
MQITLLAERIYGQLQLIVVDGLTSGVHHTKLIAFSTEDLITI